MEVTQIIIITNENFQGESPDYYTTKEKYVDCGYILVKKILLDGNGEVTIVNINGSHTMFSGFKYKATSEEES